MHGNGLRILGFALVTMGVAGVGSGSRAGTTPDFVRITPSDIAWQDVPSGHGAQQAVLLGDPNKPGWYVVREGPTEGGQADPKQPMWIDVP